MSLYNLMFGYDKLAPILLEMLGLTPADIPRFRDCYLHNDRIVVCTRTGGGNRDFYESEEKCRANYPESFTGEDDPSGPWNEDLRGHPHYLDDRDNHMDSTYAYFFFSFPKEHEELLNSWGAGY